MSDDLKRSRYRYGLLFAWIPTLPLIILAISVARQLGVGAAQNRATGLGAVAGGLSQALVLSGFILIFAAGITGIILLARSFSRAHLGRSIFASLSILLSLVLLILFAAGLWLFRP